MWKLFSLMAGALAALAFAACGGDADPETRLVPGDHVTIQEAVDASGPGDLILIESGTYEEQVLVDVDDLVIRGVDRNEVVIDGGDAMFNGFFVIADGVAIENLTVQRFTQNGVIFTGLTGYSEGTDSSDDDETLERYRVSHVTAINNGTYGIYSFAARGGLITDTYASGHPDSGFYVGQCKPCDVVLDNVTAERNSIGYFGTNASGGVFVINSTFRENRLGITPNSQIAERLAPQNDAVIAGNLVVDNDSAEAPVIPRGFFGGGIAVGGGIGNQIINNRVEGHEGFGIGLVPLDDFAPIDNRIEGNVLADNGVDLVVDGTLTDGEPQGNCFVGNDFTTEQPAEVVVGLACGEDAVPYEPVPFPTPPAPPAVDYRGVAEPGPQASMLDAATAPAVPAGEPPVVDVASITVPSR